MFLFFLTLLSLTFSINAIKVPLCKGIEYSNRVVDCLLNVAVYSYSFNLTIDINNNNKRFPNKLIFDNFSHWSLNESLYYQLEPISVWYLQSYNYTCPSFIEECEVEFPNERGYHSYPIMANGQKDDVISRMQLLFDSGFIYSLSDQSSYNLFDGKCFKKSYPRDCKKGTTFIDYETACCNEFVDIEIPDKNDEICEEYENKATFIDIENSTIFTFSAIHTLSIDGLNVTVNNFSTVHPNTIYKYGPDWYNCQNNETSTTSKCFITFPVEDFYYNLLIQIDSYNETYEALLGRFIRRNGTYLKYSNIPYTEDDPCWNQTISLIEPNGTVVESSLCCKKFRKNEATTMKSQDVGSNNDDNSSLILLVTAALGCACFAIFGFTIWKCGCTKRVSNEIIVPVREEKSLTISSAISEAFSDISVEEPNIFIKFHEVLGQGSTCTVYAAEMKNATITNCKTVAIKIPTCYEDNHLDEVMHELSIIHKLERQHPSICSTILWTTHRDIPCLIFEKMEKNLLHFVKDFPDENFSSTVLFHQILWQISNALEFIATKNVIHRDVAARNILISAPNIAKLSDFGLWCECNNESLIYFSNFRKKLPYRWLSIEALKDKIFSEKSDVWSFGIVMYEIWSKGKVPYFDKENIDLIEFLSDGNRLETPEVMTDDIAAIMKSCWNEDTEKRPNFQQLKTQISELLKHSRTDDYCSFNT